MTASNRLARYLRIEAAERHEAAGQAAWRAPRILPWESWLQSLWTEAAYSPGDEIARPPLSARQNASMWRRSVSHALADSTHLNVRGLAAQAARSWRLASDWALTLDDIEPSAYSADSRFFLRAARHFTDACRAGGWQDPATLADALVGRIERGTLTVPNEIGFIGFDMPNPVHSALVAALRASGADCRYDAPKPYEPCIQVQRHEDRDAELMAAGAWARERLLADPGLRIAIIVPDLASRAETAARLVAETFVPGWQFAGRPRHGINVSYGRPLADYALVDSARTAVSLLVEQPTFSALSRMLRSPFFDGARASPRAALELRLRELPDRRWRMDDLRALSRRAVPQAAGFVDVLAELAERRGDPRSAHRPAVWAQRIDSALTELGWPGSCAPDSENYQLLNAWRTALNELASLDAVCGLVTADSAVAELDGILRETIFQPETAQESLQLLGILEASGLRFDAIWIAGMDSTTWPPPQRPDTLLPLSLQRERGMPDSTPAQTLDFAQRTFRRLLASAPEVRISCARQDGEATLTASPLLAGLPRGRAVERPEYYATTLAGSLQQEIVDPDTAPAVAADERIPGGHAVLTAQRTQPFDAFARFRLRAQPIEVPVAGLSARDRGKIVHRALEIVFQETWQALSTRAEDERRQLVDEAVRSTLRRYRAGADARLSALIGMEQARSTALVRRFLELDARREPPQTVICEEKRRVRVGPLMLEIRPDRVDAIDGGWLLIDYKTGVSGTAIGADADDPRQLQLVVYAMSQTGNVLGLALALVHPHRIAYRGVRDDRLDWPDKSLQPVEDWSALLNAWKSQAHVLAETVARGDARVNLTLPASEQRPLAVLSRYAELLRDA